MKTRLLLVAGLLGLAFATGCIQSYDEFTLNPDGSGKVLHRTTVVAMNLGGESDGSPESKARDAVKSMVHESEGVDAWRDVTYAIQPNGGVQVEGVAYFRDLTKLRFDNGGLQNGEDDLQVEIQPGRITVQLGAISDEPKAGTLTEEELTRKIAESRQSYNQSKPMMTGFLASLRVERIFRLPGTPEAVHVFEQGADGSIRNVLEGERMLAALDELMADDAYLRDQALRDVSPGEGSAYGDPLLMKKMFGTSDLPRATFVNAGGPVFDYAAEVAKATAEQAAMLAALGVSAPVIAKPATGGGSFTELEIAGIQWVRKADSDNGIHPFNSFETAYQLSVIGTLPGAVLDVTEGEVTEATDNLGNDLLPEEGWDRRLSFPSLSTTKDKVVFSIKLESPSAAATGLRAVAGNLEYLVAGPTREVDIGISRFAAGQTGSEFGASITKIGKSDWSDEIVLSLKLDLPSASIENVSFRDSSGKEFATEQGGTMMMNDTTTIEFTTEDTWPESGSIMINTYTDMKAYQAEFRLEHIDLLGRPAE